jgi:eukaryotic-like serine/threonine-protein kinase
MPLSVGARLGPYEIVAAIGAGGMGEVYRARDTRLDRTVAVKVSQNEFSERFEREARAIAALNHPNVCALYDVGPNYLVMEHVEGTPVAGGGGFRKLLDVAAQIAAGLASAHAAGIVHRDLKPDNILITADGRVKILDFGLAKQAMRAAAADATQTVLSGATDPGTVMGTVFYMSPEQARGQVVDARSDQFSFGLVLYELATGQRAFARESTAQTMAAIIEAEPDYSLMAGTPPTFRWIVERCLAKDPRDRYDSTGDLYRDLEQLKRRQSEWSMAATGAAPSAPKQRRRWLPAAAAVVVLLAAAGGWFVRALTTDEAPRYRVVPVAVDRAASTTPAWAPDGKVLAYAQEAGGYYQIFTRRFEQRSEAPAQLTSLAADCLFPFWHPSGDRIYFLAADALWAVGAAGGQPERLIENVASAAITPDGKTIIFNRPANQGGGMWTATAEGKELTRKLEVIATDSLVLHVSPDGRKLAVGQQADSHFAVYSLPLPAGHDPGTPVKFRLAPNQFVYSSDWMPDSRHVIASVTSGFSGFSLALCDTSSGKVEPLPSAELPQGTPSVSRDGARIAYSTFALNWDIFQVDLVSHAVTPLIASARYDGWPAWTPSGDHLLFATNRTGSPEIWWKSTREEWEHPLLTPADFDEPSTRLLAEPAVSPDGRSMAYVRYSESGVALFMSPLSGGKPVALDPGRPGRHDSPAWSPDGNWIAFAVKNQLRKVRPGSRSASIQLRDDVRDNALIPIVRWSRAGQILYSANSGLAVIDGEGAAPRIVSNLPLACDWSPDGASIYAIREGEKRRLELIHIDAKSGAIRLIGDLGRRPVTPEPIGYHDNIRALAVSPDGKRAVFAYLQPDSQVWMLEATNPR